MSRAVSGSCSRGMFPADTASGGVDVLATIWNADRIAETLGLAGELRAAGLRVEVYPDADKLGKQMKYASTRGARFVTIEGDDREGPDHRRADAGRPRRRCRMARRAPFVVRR